MKLWLAVLASLLFIPVVGGLSAPADPNRIVLNWVCDYQNWDCSTVPTPKVIVSQIVPPMYYGMYFNGEQYIFISTGLSAEQAKETLTHETVHYLVDRLGIQLSKCDNEALARSVTALVLNTDYDHSWRARYRCPQTS